MNEPIGNVWVSNIKVGPVYQVSHEEFARWLDSTYQFTQEKSLAAGIIKTASGRNAH